MGTNKAINGDTFLFEVQETIGLDAGSSYMMARLDPAMYPQDKKATSQ